MAETSGIAATLGKLGAPAEQPARAAVAAITIDGPDIRRKSISKRA
jgi:hypothetical protein